MSQVACYYGCLSGRACGPIYLWSEGVKCSDTVSSGTGVEWSDRMYVLRSPLGTGVGSWRLCMRLCGVCVLVSMFANSHGQVMLCLKRQVLLDS